MSIEKGIRFELLARLCPNSTGEWRGERGEGEGEGVSACVCASKERRERMHIRVSLRYN